MEYWLAFWWVFFVAVTICVTVCTVGIEGAILFVPFFAVVFPLIGGRDISPTEAIQIGLLTEIFGFTSSFFGFFRAKLIDWHIGWFSTLVAVPLALVGGFLTYILPPWTLLAIMALVLPVMGYLVLTEPAAAEGSCEISEGPLVPAIAGGSNGSHMRSLTDRLGRPYVYSYQHDAVRAGVSGLGGFFEGVVGFGIGAAGITHLIKKGIPVRVAIGTSHMIIMFTAFAAVSPHIAKIFHGGSVPWNIVIFTIPAVAIGGQIAPMVTGLVPQSILKRFIGGLMVTPGLYHSVPCALPARSAVTATTRVPEGRSTWMVAG